jgi:hypothetical protein
MRPGVRVNPREQLTLMLYAQPESRIYACLLASGNEGRKFHFPACLTDNLHVLLTHSSPRN